jgi:cytochrome P450
MEPGKENSGGANSNYAMLTFSAGPKSCIGEVWTRAELACLVAVMVGAFEIELVEGKQAVGTVYPTAALKIGKTMKLRDGVFARLRRLENW